MHILQCKPKIHACMHALNSNPTVCLLLQLNVWKSLLHETMKDVMNQAMASESNNPAATVSIFSLKRVLGIAVRL